MNKGKRWNNSENNLLINKIINSNENILNEISLNLGRSKFAVIKQLEKLLLQKNIDINLIYEQVLLTHIKLFFNLNNNKLEDSEYITDDIQNTLIKNEISIWIHRMVHGGKRKTQGKTFKFISEELLINKDKTIIMFTDSDNYTEDNSFNNLSYYYNKFSKNFENIIFIQNLL